MTIRPITFLASEVLGLLAGAGLYSLVLTPTDISLLIGAIATLITALGMAIAAIMAARRVEARVVEVNNGVQAVHAETKVISGETKVIGGHVNSFRTEQTEKIDALQKENDLLRSVMAKDEKTAALLAQAKVQATAPAPIAIKDGGDM